MCNMFWVLNPTPTRAHPQKNTWIQVSKAQPTTTLTQPFGIMKLKVQTIKTSYFSFTKNICSSPKRVSPWRSREKKTWKEGPKTRFLQFQKKIDSFGPKPRFSGHGQHTASWGPNGSLGITSSNSHWPVREIWGISKKKTWTTKKIRINTTATRNSSSKKYACSFRKKHLWFFGVVIANGSYQNLLLTRQVAQKYTNGSHLAKLLSQSEGLENLFF